MTSILAVCTGNICRSPLAEGFLRSILVRRFGVDAPTVGSAGTDGWEGSGAMPGSVMAAAERGVDISGHSARVLTVPMAADADLVLCMASENRDAVVAAAPELTGRTYTLKELVRILEAFGPAAFAVPGSLEERVREADALRLGGFTGNPLDEDVADPLGQPDQVYRAIAWELEEWCGRLVDGIYGAVPQAAAVSGEEA